MTDNGSCYRSRAFHNFTSRFWLRNQVYPHLGFESFETMENMQVEMQPSGWPKDDALYAQTLKRAGNGDPQFNFLVTVATHGPFAEDNVKDLEGSGAHPGITDYHDRLSGAADALLAFDAELRHRGRPYVLLVFGDHLPGLRQHQSMIGMTDNNDPRLHQVPFLISGNTGEAQALRDRLMGRPFYCFSPLIADQLGLDVADRYFRHMVKACSDSPTPNVVTAEPVIQNQLFSDTPLL
jgi:phosphoglycerol transferase MdoB-like AlkP superfamily enzyme